MNSPISVTKLNNQIKSLLESTFLHVRVEGEVSRPTYHSSGHLYFTLKDADSAISCVMFKGNNQKLPFRLEDGMHIIVFGSISLYAPRGSYQINCLNIEPYGSGALALAYEQLKKELEAKGYFDSTNKKPLPKFPKKIALITSASGAAIEDMRHVAAKRWPLVKLILIDSLVQGKEAAPSIVRSIKKAQNLSVDIIILARGGGSVEDLWAFNEKEVALALFESKVPTISAIGHEIDYVITDFIADKRAPTPSAAMEIALPDLNEQKMSIDYLSESLLKKVEWKIGFLFELIKQMQKALIYKSPKSKLKYKLEEILNIAKSLKNSFAQRVQKEEFLLKEYSETLQNSLRKKLYEKELNLKSLMSAYEAKSTMFKIKESFAQILYEGKPVNLNELKVKDEIEIETLKRTLGAKIVKIKEN